MKSLKMHGKEAKQTCTANHPISKLETISLKPKYNAKFIIVSMQNELNKKRGIFEILSCLAWHLEGLTI